MKFIFCYYYRFGVFTNKEKNDFKLILTRFFSSLITPSEFNKILSQESCNINKQDFLHKIDTVKYSRNFHEHCTESKNSKKLLDSLNEMCQENNESTSSLELLEQGILEGISYISQDSLEFLKSNDIIAFTLILLQYLKKNNDKNLLEGESLKEIFTKQKELKIGHLTITREIFANILDRFPYLKNEIEEKSSQINITMYQLLEGFKNFDSKRVFKWRQKNELMPNFSSAYLIHKYGHKEKLTYINYLKESRPNMAYSILYQLDGKSLRNISSKM